MKKHIIALIVAAGSGSRMEGTTPKQYRNLNGKTVLRRSVEAFLSHPDIDGVQVVISPEHRAFYDESVAGLTLPEPIAGGKERQDSARKGVEHLSKYQPQPEFVLVHDAARCLIDVATISRVVAALDSSDAVIPTVAVRDTLKRVENQKVSATIPRDFLHRVQTPQGFRTDTLQRLHTHFAGQGFTDDAALAEAADLTVACVEGSERNFKLTTTDDWELAAMLLAAHTDTRTATGYDVHKLIPATDGGIWLCGVKIPHSHELEGHSDADVGLHALVDAMLGTIAAGDIGQHFPPTDPRWKGADSSVFVRHALSLLHEAGADLRHVDITLICEAPKISPHRDAMRARVAELTGLPIESVSVKATTSEGLGFTGRREGIAAQAAATIRIEAKR